MIISDYHFRTLPLWYNSLVRVENRPVFFKEWFLKGITKVEHLRDDSGKFLLLTAFQTTHNLTVRPLTFHGIISSIKLLQRYIPHNTRMWTKHESFLSNFLKSKKPSQLVYKKLESGKSESPSQSQQKWHKDFFTTEARFQLERGLSNGFSMYKEHKTYNFQFQIPS